MESDCYSVSEAATILGVSFSTVARYCDMGLLKFDVVKKSGRGMKRAIHARSVHEFERPKMGRPAKAPAAMLLMALLLVLLTAAPVAAEEITTTMTLAPYPVPYPGPATDVDPTNVISVLQWAVSGAAGVALAFLLERWGRFQALPKEQKAAWVVGITVLLPIFGQAALDLVPVAVWAAVQPYWAAAMRGLMLYAGSQVAHRLWLREAGE